MFKGIYKWFFNHPKTEICVAYILGLILGKIPAKETFISPVWWVVWISVILFLIMAFSIADKKRTILEVIDDFFNVGDNT